MNTETEKSISKEKVEKEIRSELDNILNDTSEIESLVKKVKQSFSKDDLNTLWMAIVNLSASVEKIDSFYSSYLKTAKD